MMSTNYFVENNRMTSVMISKDCVHYQDYKKIHRFFKNIIISSKDNIDVSKKNGKEKI